MAKTETKDEVYVCAKCGKKKKKSEGVFMLEGTAFCCKECCGEVSRGEHKEKAAAVCEFC